MTITEYRKAVIDLFKSETASEGSWDEMASVVLAASENGDIDVIDRQIYGNCVCGGAKYPGHDACIKHEPQAVEE